MSERLPPMDDIESIPLDDDDAEDAPLPGYERARARALVLPQVDVVGDASAPAEGASMGSSTMREGDGEYREIDVDQKREAPRQEYGLADAARDTLLTIGGGGNRRGPTGGDEAARRRVMGYADRTITDAAIGSSEGTTGEYQGGNAGITGLVTNLPLVGGFMDEIRGGARSALRGTDYETERDAARRDIAAAEEQNPAVFGIGRVGGIATGAAIPIPGGAAATAAGRIGQAAAMGAGMGAVEGYGRSEQEGAAALRDSLGGSLVGAGAGAIGGAAVEGATAVPGAVARWLQRRAQGASQRAVPLRLEASGVSGQRALQAADQQFGGPMVGRAELARELRTRGVGGSVPQAGQALEDAVTMSRGSGAQIGSALDGAPGPVSRALDEAGASVDLSRVADALEEVARREDSLAVGGVGDALRRELIEPLRQAGRVPFSGAHAQRQALDRLVRSWTQQPTLAASAGRIREARSLIDDAMSEAAESTAPDLARAWSQSNRDHHIGRFLQEFGRGGDRAQQGGGIAGAAAEGIMQAEVLSGAASPAMLATGAATREVAQQARSMQPGLRARFWEGVEQRATSTADWLTETLRTTPQALGPYARHFRQAIERGLPTDAVATVHFLLSQRDPEYRATVERARAQESDR